MTRWRQGIRGRLLSVLAALVALAAVYGLSTASHPATVGSTTPLGQETRAEVSSAVRACPSPGSTGITAASLATLAVPGSATKGSAVVTRLSGTGAAAAAPVRTLTVPGVLRVSPVPAVAQSHHHSPGQKKAASSSSGGVTTGQGVGGVMVRASGALAQGLEVEQTGPHGLVTAQCPAPGTDFWFVGPGVSSAPHVDLYLMNTDAQAADVEVNAETDAGPLLSSTDTGIVVPPHGLVVQSLGRLLRSSRVVALHVSTSIGRVAVAVRESKSAAQEGGWLPPAAEPAKTLVIPGLPGTSGSRELFVAVPGSGNAEVKVTAVTAKGSYQPTGGNGVDLPGDSAVSVQLPSLSGVAGAVKITSSVPVTAALMTSGGASGAPGALTAATVPVSQQGIAADNPVGSAGSAELVISAPAGAATVAVATGDAKTAVSGTAVTGPHRTLVHVAKGHSVVTKLKAPSGKAAGFSVVVTPQPGSGPVYVGRLISSGSSLQTILPLTSALAWVPLPGVRDSLDALGPTARGAGG